MPQHDSKANNFVVFDIHQDRQGILRLATSNNLLKFDGTNANWLTVNDGLPCDNVRAIPETCSGTLLVGTYGGIAELKDGKILTILTEKDGLAGDHVRSLYEDAAQTIWIGTYESGLSRLKNGKITNFNTETGTRRTAFYPHLSPGEYTFRVIAANSDNVWNEQGASIISGEPEISFIHRQFETFNRSAQIYFPVTAYLGKMPIELFIDE